MVLVVGIDANQLGESSNQAAPLGRANADALLLLRVSAEEPLQVLQLPSEIAVQLPGKRLTDQFVQPLAKRWGGVVERCHSRHSWVNATGTSAVCRDASLSITHPCGWSG